MFLLFGLAACGPRQADEANFPLGESEVVARVNGNPIYEEEVQIEAIGRGLIREGETLPRDTNEYYQLLEDIIETKLFAREAESRGLDRSGQIRRRLETARERILAGALDEEIIDNALKPSAIERMYRQQTELLEEGKEIRARRILLGSEESALAAKRRLENGELFEAVAYEVSMDRATAAEGGELGFFFPDALPDALRIPLQSAKVGEVVGPLQTPEGWQLYRVEERRESEPPSLDAMRPQIINFLMFEERRRLVEKLSSAARIERLVPSGAATLEGIPTPPPPPENEPAAAEAEPGAQTAPAAPPQSPSQTAPQSQPQTTPQTSPQTSPQTAPKGRDT